MNNQAVYHTFLVTDIVGFGREDRTDALRTRLREALRRMVEESLEEAGLRWNDCGPEDRGDAVFLVIPPHVPKIRLLDRFVLRMTTELALHNQSSSGPACLQLRIAAHAGEVSWDKHGAIGTDVNTTFRLAEAAELKKALADSGCDLGVIVSDPFYEVIRQRAALIGAHEYRPIQVDVKELHSGAWITLRPSRQNAGGKAPPASSGAKDSGLPADRPGGGAPARSGGVSFRDYTIVNAPVVGGNNFNLNSGDQANRSRQE